MTAMRRRLLLILILVVVPVTIGGVSMWFVASGRLITRLEGLWDLPGQLSITSLRLTGTSSARLGQVRILSETGLELVHLEGVQVSGSIWSQRVTELRCASWTVTCDQARLPAWRALIAAAQKRPASETPLPRIVAQDGELVIASQRWRDCRLQLTPDAAGARIRLENEDLAVAITSGPSGSVSVEQLSVSLNAAGADFALIGPEQPFPGLLDLAGSTAHWQADGTWQAALRAHWAHQGRCVIAAAGAGLTTAEITLESLFLPELALPVQIDQGRLAYEAQTLATACRLHVEHGAGGWSVALRGEQEGDLLAIIAEQQAEDWEILVRSGRLDLAALGTTLPAWLPARIDLRDSRLKITPPGRLEARLEARWPSGSVRLHGRFAAGDYQLSVEALSDNRLPGSLHVDAGRWQLGPDLVIDSLRVQGNRAATELIIAQEAAAPLRFEFRRHDGGSLRWLEGALPLGPLLRLGLAEGWLAPGLAPIHLFLDGAWRGNGSRIDGLFAARPRIHLDLQGPEGSLQLAGERTSEGWTLPGCSLRLRGVLDLDATVHWSPDRHLAVAWERLVIFPALLPFLPTRLDWALLCERCPRGRLALGPSDDGWAGTLEFQGPDAASLAARCSWPSVQIDWTGQRLPVPLAAAYLPAGLTAPAGLVHELTGSYAANRLNVRASLRAVSLHYGDYHLRGLEGTLHLRPESDGAVLGGEIQLPAIGRLQWRPAGTRLEIDWQVDDLARLRAAYASGPALPELSGGLDGSLIIEHHANGLRGQLRSCALRALSLPPVLTRLSASVAGVFRSPADDAGLDAEISGQIDDLGLALGAHELTIDDLHPRFLIDGSIDPAGLWIRRARFDQATASGAVIANGLSLGLRGRWRPQAEGGSSLRLILDRVDLAWLRAHCPWISMPADSSLAGEVAAVLRLRMPPGGPLDLSGEILALDADLDLLDEGVRIQGLRGSLHLPGAAEDAHEGVDDHADDHH